MGLLPTPRTEGFDAGAHRGKPDSLHSYVKLLPTPTNQDGSNDGGPSQMARNTPPLNALVRMLPTPHADDTGHRTGNYQQGGTALSTQIGGSLNPAFVEWLQGYPAGWMDVTE